MANGKWQSGSLGRLQLLSFLRGQIGQMRAAAELEGADVGGDGPAVGGFDAFGVRIHNAVAVGDDVVKVADGRLAEAIDVIGRGRRKTALDDHSVAFAGAAMANGTKYVEAFAAALE